MVVRHGAPADEIYRVVEGGQRSLGITLGGSTIAGLAVTDDLFHAGPLALMGLRETRRRFSVLADGPPSGGRDTRKRNRREER